MYPIPTQAARLLFAASLLGALGGFFMQSATVITMSLGIWIVLGVARTLATPMGRRLRRQRLEFAWWLDHGSGPAGGSVVSGTPFAIRCFVRHRGTEALDVTELSPVVTPTLHVFQDHRAMRLEGASRSEFTIDVRASAAGRVVLHGLAVTLRGPLGLFDTPLYFPNPLTIRVLPRAAALRSLSVGTHRAASYARGGNSRAWNRGSGTELHELRELQPGDPFKAIAWKASARRGRLMVREVEQELQQTLYVLLDTSGTMRAGEPGNRKLDYALDLVAGECRRAISRGDQVALITFGSRMTTHIPPKEGKAQMLQIYDALISETEVVDADRTQIEEDALAEVVAAYLRQQDGVDFRRRGRIQTKGLVRHVRRVVGHRGASIVADTSGSRALRRFCLERGLHLPSKSDTQGKKSKALRECLALAVARGRTPATIVVVTDFDDMNDLESLKRPLRLVKRHGHHVQFVLPDGRAFMDEKAPSGAITTIFARSEERRLKEAQQFLGRLGVRSALAGPTKAAEPVVERPSSPVSPSRTWTSPMSAS